MYQASKPYGKAKDVKKKENSVDRKPPTLSFD